MGWPRALAARSRLDARGSRMALEPSTCAACCESPCPGGPESRRSCTCLFVSVIELLFVVIATDLRSPRATSCARGGDIELHRDRCARPRRPRGRLGVARRRVRRGVVPGDDGRAGASDTTRACAVCGAVAACRLSADRRGGGSVDVSTTCTRASHSLLHPAPPPPSLAPRAHHTPPAAASAPMRFRLRTRGRVGVSVCRRPRARPRARLRARRLVLT